MKTKMYTVLDTKAVAFLSPWFASTHALAFRNCEKACRNPESPFRQFPADFNLFCIGEFDDELGVVVPYSLVENLGNFVQFQPQVDPSALPGPTAKVA